MSKKDLSLKLESIESIFDLQVKRIFEIPIYQRNYAWEKDEISALINDVYDAFVQKKKTYYIGTLVTYQRDNDVFEVIDGQQRLTTLCLILKALGEDCKDKLTYRARKKSDKTLARVGNDDLPANDKNAFEIDYGIEAGFGYVQNILKEYGYGKKEAKESEEFKEYLEKNVCLVHYRVPKDIDLNHYFEIMNSRGEQLEKHEIEKARLMSKLKDDTEKKVFGYIWESCSEMGVYVQQNLNGFIPEKVFGDSLCDFQPKDFDELVKLHKDYAEPKKKDEDKIPVSKTATINDILDPEKNKEWLQPEEKKEIIDTFLPIIDFPNFLLIVLKLMRMEDSSFKSDDLSLDDKALLLKFGDIIWDAELVKKYAFMLLKARFLLDNYIVHSSKEEEMSENNPWKVQCLRTDNENGKTRKSLTNLVRREENRDLQDRLVTLLSMFEVTFSFKQRKNYLVYCLHFLMNNNSLTNDVFPTEYAGFLEKMADRFFFGVYLGEDQMNENNKPKPGSFDEVMLEGNRLREDDVISRTRLDFVERYGDGTEESKGIPLYVFNYIDYKLWDKYMNEVRGKDDEKVRANFFAELGCGDFDKDIFNHFYFSRTRGSLEHFYAQATAKREEDDSINAKINCLGNYAMISSKANSSGSDWDPTAKLHHYLDSSKKISPVGTASLKFRIMMKMCEDNGNWGWAEIKSHQDKMLTILFGDEKQ